MIRKLENFSYKTFRGYTGPDDEFLQKNIIFGYNGQGKSSVAIGIKRELGKNEDINIAGSLRFFNREYVKNNMLLEDAEHTGGKIRGIKAHFGKEDVDREKTINEELLPQIIDSAPLRREVEKLREETRKEINRIHDRRKGSTPIQKKATSIPVEKVVQAYQADLDKARKIEQDEKKLRKIEGDDSLEKERGALENLVIPELPLLDEKRHLEVERILLKNFQNNEIPTNDIVAWLNSGIAVHEKHEASKCFFCGNQYLDLRAIKTKVQEYNENEQQKSIETLEDFSGRLKQLESALEKILELEKTSMNVLGVEIGSCFTEMKKALTAVQSTITIIDKKMADMAQVIDYSSKSTSQAIDLAAKARKQLSDTQKAKLRNIGEKLNRLSDLVKGAIGLEITDSGIIKNNIDKIYDYEKEANGIEAKNKKIHAKIHELKSQKTGFSAFAQQVNQVLKNLNISLALSVDSEGYIIQSTIDESAILTTDDISEGEKNLLALLFFYFELFEDLEKRTLRSEITTILIDDPISSMDDMNRFFVLELLKNLLDLKEPQVFIFTHVWEDFNALCYGRADKDADNPKFRFFEVIKTSHGSRMARTETGETPYRKLFQEIDKLANRKEDEVCNMDECEVYHLPNSMRRVLEDFLSFKVPYPFSPTRNKQPQIEQLLNIKKEDEKTQLGMLLSACNTLSHHPGKAPQEIWLSAKFLMKKIKEIDKTHYDAMLHC